MSDHSETKDTRMNAEEETKSCEEPTDSKEETKELPFSVKTWTEDLKLIVEGKSIYVNKATLALLSPVFEKMFNANFRERDCEELELPDKEYDSFIEFLDCVYPGHHTCHKEVTVETAYNVVRLADEYQIPDLLERCDAVLSKSIRSDVQTSDIYFNLKVAHTYNLRKLQARCIELASERPLAEMMDNKKKHEIPSDIQEIILSRGLRRHELDIIEYKEIIRYCKGEDDKLTSKIENNLKGQVFGIFNASKYNLPQEEREIFNFRIMEKVDGEAQNQLKKMTVEDLKKISADVELFRLMPLTLKEEIRSQFDRL